MQHLSVYMYGVQSCYCYCIELKKSFKFRDEPFKLSCWVERDTISVKLFYLEKNRSLKLGKRHTAPLYPLSQSTAKNNVWYYQQVLLWFSVGGEHNTSIGNPANKLMAIFKCCNGNARAIKERSVKHTQAGKDPNTWKITWERN